MVAIFYVLTVTENKIVNIIYAVSFYLFPALTIYAVVVISKNSRMPGFWKITMSIILVLILLLMIRYHVYQIDKYRSLKVKGNRSQVKMYWFSRNWTNPFYN